MFTGSTSNKPRYRKVESKIWGEVTLSTTNQQEAGGDIPVFFDANSEAKRTARGKQGIL